MKIEYILLACDNNPKFLSFLPSVSYHWKSMGYKVAFGLVTDTDISGTMETNIRSMVDDFYIHRYDAETCEFPAMVMGKLFRFYISKYYPTNTVCIQDIDYYVFDKHEHIESRIVDPANEVLTHGFNAYYSSVAPRRLKRRRTFPWQTVGEFPYVQGVEPNALVFDSNGCIGPPSETVIIPNKRIQVPCEIRFPATPMVAHGRLIYQIFSTNTSETFIEFLSSLRHRQKELASSALEEGFNGNSDFYHAEFSDETLIKQLNRTNGVRYRHTKREDFLNGIAQRRIDPRRTSYEADWVPNSNGKSIRSLMENGYIIDIQPVRPLQESAIMNDVFAFLNIPISLQDLNSTLYEPCHNNKEE